MNKRTLATVCPMAVQTQWPSSISVDVFATTSLWWDHSTHWLSGPSQKTKNKHTTDDSLKKHKHYIATYHDNACVCKKGNYGSLLFCLLQPKAAHTRALVLVIACPSRLCWAILPKKSNSKNNIASCSQVIIAFNQQQVSSHIYIYGLYRTPCQGLLGFMLFAWPSSGFHRQVPCHLAKKRPSTNRR